MENQSIIKVFVDQADKVVYGNRGYIGIKLQPDSPTVFHSDCYNWILCHKNNLYLSCHVIYNMDCRHIIPIVAEKRKKVKRQGRVSMYYLRRVEVILEKKEYEAGFQPMLEALKEKGVKVIVNGAWAVQGVNIAVNERGETQGVNAAVNEGWEVQEVSAVKEAAGNAGGTLLITDCASLAERAAAAGSAVLVFLHGENREQNFMGVRYAFEEPGELGAEYLEQVYRRYAGLPWDILDTKRCRLRETTVADLDDFYRIYAEPSITQYMENLYSEVEQEKEYTRKYIENVYGFYGFGVWTVVKKDTGEVIGRAGISYREGFEEPELGFVIGVPWQGQGYAYEVCRAVLQYGREQLGFEKVQALVEPENKVSLHLCAKLGMTGEGVEMLQKKQYIRLLKKWP